MWTVIRRELKTYFYTPAAYVFLSVFWLIGGIFFYLYNILARTADLSPLFGNLSYVLMLLSPLLTMRLVSDEKKRRTDLFFYIMPVSCLRIVLGKYISSLLVVFIGLTGTLLYVGILALFLPLSFLRIFACYLGFALLASVYLSIGLFISSLTESQLTAAVMTLAVYLLLQLGEMAAGSVNTPYLPFLPALLSLIKLNSRFSAFTSGLFTPEDIAYDLLIAALFLTMTNFLLQAQKLRRKST